MLGEAVVLNSTLTDDNGNLIEDATLKFYVTDGKGKYEVNATFDRDNNIYKAYYTIINAGLNNVTVSYEGASIKTGAYDVPKFNATFNMTVEDIIRGENVTIFLNLTGPNGLLLNASDIIIIINDTDYKINITNGTGNLTVENLTIDSYPVTAIFNGETNYNLAYASAIFYVRGNTTIAVQEIKDAVYEDTILVNLTLTDVDKNNLTGIVAVNIAGKEYNVLVENGTGLIAIERLDEGEYNVIAQYDGDNLHNASVNDTVSFKITPRPIGEENVTVNFKVNYDEGNQPVNVSVEIKAFDGNYTVKIDDTKAIVEVVDGVGVVDLTHSRGNKTANISLEVKNYNLTEFTKEFVYKALPEFNVTFDGTYPEVTITVNGTNGTYNVSVANKSVIIKVTDTVANGTIKGLDAGEYTARVEYIDNINFTQRVEEYDFNVSKATPEFKANVTGNLTYTNSVDFNITGTNGTYNVKINDTLSFNVTVVNSTIIEVLSALNAGEYKNVNVTYLESKNYNESSILIDFTIAKAIPDIKLNVTVTGEGIYPGEINVVVTSDVAGLYNLTINNITSEISITPGIAYINKSTNIAAGKHDVTVNFTGNSNYENLTVTKEFTINKATPVFTVEVLNVTYSSDVVIKINGSKGTYNVTVNDDNKKQVNITESVAEATFTGLAAGTYENVKVEYIENENYTSLDASVTFTVPIKH